MKQPLLCVVWSDSRKGGVFLFFKRMAALGMALALLFSTTLAETFDVLLIGVDAAADGQRGRSDTMMLARVEPQSGAVRLVSFLRDLYVPIPGHGRTRLNAAYFYGGEELLAQTLGKNFGVLPDRTVTVDFAVLRDLVDELGGIELEITEAERTHLNRLLEESGQAQEKLSASGLQRLSGAQALMYSRIRKLDSDFQRTSRQQAVIAALLREMSRFSRWDLFKLAVKNLGRVKTDLSISDLTTLAPLFGKLQEMEIQTAHVPFEGTFTEETVNGMMVLMPDLGRNQAKLEAFFK